MKKLRLAVVAAVAAFTGLAAAGAAQAADESGVYVGAGLGTASLSEKNGGVDGALARSQGITSTSDVKKTELQYNLNLGYQFNKNFAVEGGWTGLGSRDVTGSISAPGTGSLTGKVKTSFFDVAGVATLPVQDGFGVYAKLGMARTSTKVDLNSNGAVNPADTSDNRWTPLYGLGASYAFNSDIDGTLEFDRVDRFGSDTTTGRFNANIVTAGLRLRF